MVFFIATVSLLYEDVKKRTIEDFNTNQKIHAMQATRSIQDEVGSIISTLSFLARLPEIIDLGGNGRETLDKYLLMHAQEIKCVTRVDMTGRIIYTTPANAALIGRDISSRSHVRTVLETRKTTLSDVFTTEQGYRTIAIHVPVFKGDEFKGTLAVLLSLDYMARRNIENIKVSKSGYAWIISEKGVEISCQVPGHVGRSIRETCRGFPDVLAMADHMMKGEEGTATYHFDQIGGVHVEGVVKHAVYQPIRLGNTFWSIVIATPEDEVLAPLSGFRLRLLVITIILLFLAILFTFYLVKSLTIMSEQEKRNAVMKALDESERTYRTLVETTGTGFVIVDEEGCVIDANNEYVRLTGHEKLQDILGRDVAEWTAGHEAQKNKDEVKKCLEQGYVRNLEIDYVDLRGSITHIEINATMVEMGGAKRILALCRDISERKKTDAALRESGARYRFLMDNMTDMIWMANQDLCVTYASPSIEKALGYKPEERIGRKTSEIMTAESYAHAVKLMVAELERENQEGVDPNRAATYESAYYHKNGSIVWFENAASLIRDDKGRITGIYGVSRDITARKKAEEEKKKLEIQLSHAQKMESIGTLAGGIAHDFNNLLTGILGNVSLALMPMDAGSPLYERLKNVEEYVKRGSDLTKQLLGFARGGMYEVKATNLGEFIRKSSEMFGRTKKEVRIHHKMQEGLWPVEVDRGQMDQVFLNLYVNSWQAMNGGGDLYLSAENVELGEMDVKPYDARPGGFVKVTVKDTGMGMDEATRSRIFEPFFTTKERGRGTGLGLASVYGIVKNHGGFIAVESEKGVGTTFMIYLPASAKPVEEEGQTKGDLRMGQETILLIDDEQMILDVGAQMLESLGYKVITAPGGKHGLQIFEQERNRIDLVILDMIMPDMAGKDTFETLRLIDPSACVMLSSGYSLDGEATEIMRRGCRGFIQKPFNMDDLSKRIREILDV
jgi:two-component system, cell cycle sensor histidine kinase and response regulator CckA